MMDTKFSLSDGYEFKVRKMKLLKITHGDSAS